MNESGFGARMEGKGPRWAAIEQLFAVHCKRLGLDDGEAPGVFSAPTTFRRPTAQRSLFET